MHTNPATTDTLPILQPVVREYLAGGRVKGSILRAPVLWARECASTHQWSDLQVSLPAEVRRAIASVFVAARWYPFAWLVDFQRAIVSTLGDADRSILRQAGRHAAATNLASILRALDRDDPHRFLHLSGIAPHAVSGLRLRNVRAPGIRARTDGPSSPPLLQSVPL